MSSAVPPILTSRLEFIILSASAATDLAFEIKRPLSIAGCSIQSLDKISIALSWTTGEPSLRHCTRGSELEGTLARAENVALVVERVAFLFPSIDPSPRTLVKAEATSSYSASVASSGSDNKLAIAAIAVSAETIVSIASISTAYSCCCSLDRPRSEISNCTPSLMRIDSQMSIPWLHKRIIDSIRYSFTSATAINMSPMPTPSEPREKQHSTELQDCQQKGTTPSVEKILMPTGSSESPLDVTLKTASAAAFLASPVSDLRIVSRGGMHPPRITFSRKSSSLHSTLNVAATLALAIGVPFLRRDTNSGIAWLCEPIRLRASFLDFTMPSKRAVISSLSGGDDLLACSCSMS
nr:hypothetical protein Iba_chr11bCG9550 [Ipomoea batatas]